MEEEKNGIRTLLFSVEKNQVSSAKRGENTDQGKKNFNY